MRDAGFRAIFCNVGDHSPDSWATVRGRADQAGIACGPWLRTADAANRFDYDKFHTLLRIADEWQSPLIVNTESEIQGSGAEITTYIDSHLEDRDAAISMEPWPFDNVAWYPLARFPMLPQLALSVCNYDEQGLRDVWHAYGIECVVITFGSFGGSAPADYDRLSPFGIYTADDCGGAYASWKPLGTVQPCSTPTPTPTPPDGDDVKIGTQDGVTASCNRWRDLDPGGTLLRKQPNGKWETLDALDATPIDKWKAYDKLERALSQLVESHDAALEV